MSEETSRTLFVRSAIIITISWFSNQSTMRNIQLSSMQKASASWHGHRQGVNTNMSSPDKTISAPKDSAFLELIAGGSPQTKEKHWGGKVIVGITGGAALALSVICLPFVSPALRRVCLPYVPATTSQVDNVLRALRGRSGRFIDLGSGDGRIVFSAAQAGFSPAEGVELNPWLVIYSRIHALRQGLSANTAFHKKDLWKFSLKPYPNIVIFGVEEMMKELEVKLEKEAADGTNIVACRFPLPTLKPAEIIGSGLDTVWLYRLQSSKNKM